MPWQVNQPRYLGTVEILAILALAGATLAAGYAEPFFGAITASQRLYLLIFYGIITVVLSGIIFSVGWLVFASDRNWTIALVATFFLAAGLFNAYQLFRLVLYLGDPRGSIQEIVALTLWARLFAATGLLLAGSVSAVRMISLASRLGLLVLVLLATAAIFNFTASPAYPQFLASIFVDSNAVQMLRRIPLSLIVTYMVAMVAFVYRLRYSPQIWLNKLLMACCLLALAEANFVLVSQARHTHPQLGFLLLAVGYAYVYRAVFLYSIQWPIDQMNDWRERLKTNQRELAVTKLAVDGSGYYIFELDASGRIAYVSDNLCRRTGYSREELIGAEFRLLSGREYDGLLAPTQAPQGEADDPLRSELELFTRQRQSFPVAYTTTTLSDGDEQHVYAIMEDISNRKRFEAQLGENARHLRRVIDSIPFFVTILTPDGKLVDSNKAVAHSLGDADALAGKSIIDLLAPNVQNDNATELLAGALREARAGSTVSLELHIANGEGSHFVDFVLAPVRDGTGRLVNLVNTSSNITERLLIQNELKLASTVFDHSAEAILITDGNIRTLSANRAFTTITGFDEQDVLGEVPPLFLGGQHLQAMQESLRRDGHWSGEVEWLKKGGETGYQWITVTKVFEKEDSVRNYIVIFSDITDKKRAEEHIQYLAYFDPLTGLPNRVLLEDRVKQAIAAARRDSHKVGLIFLDLDHFKTINDSLGHHQGDKLLTEVARRLGRNVREADTVARQGGDEFVIVLPEIEDGATAENVARKLLTEVQLPYVLDGVELRVTISIGISVYPDDGEDFARLIMNADAAMYHAKEIGRNNVQLFVGEMSRRAAELLDMETRLRRALDREEFLLHFQPQVDLQTGNIVSFEALVRWNDPDNGMIPPAQFIPIAESRGLITQIDNYVLRAACGQNRAWQEAGLPRLPVAVNVSAKQFRDSDFVNNVREALAQAGLEPQYLELEVTETVVMQDADEVISTLEELRRLGVRLSIDDFGTGYSSLSYLKRFPIEKIKIDGSFIRDIPGDKDAFSIVQAIVSLTQQLHLKVLAEGVESVEQLEALRSIRCDEYQGYYYRPPVAADRFERILRDVGGGRQPRRDSPGRSQSR